MKNDSWYERVSSPQDEISRLIAMTPEERLAQQIRDWRATWGMSQRWLAEKAGTTQRVISLLEGGKYNPTLALLERLAEAMNLQIQIAFAPRSKP